MKNLKSDDSTVQGPEELEMERNPQWNQGHILQKLAG
jgi:hypothetical protein